MPIGYWAGWQGHSVLEAGGKLTATVDDEGDTTVSVTGVDNGANGNGEEEESKRRGLFGRPNKIAISSNSDGTVTIRPEGDNTLQIVGDPLSGAITIAEIEPEALNVADGRY